MAKKLLVVVLSCIVISSFFFSACAQKTSTTQTATPSTSSVTLTAPTTPASTGGQANWWDKLGTPQYGGTLNIRQAQIGALNMDPGNPMGGQYQWPYEGLFTPNWATDRSIWDFRSDFTPVQYYTGLIAESWTQTDPQTITVKLRQNVTWQNKAPVNGRGFTADDVVYTYDRTLGTGNGFTTPNAMLAGSLTNIEQVVAVGKYTVRFKLKSPAAISIFQVLTNVGFAPPEVLQQLVSATPAAPPSAGGPGPGGPGGPGPGGPGPAGPSLAWQDTVGTSPWMITDFKSGTSVTFSKNANYWGTDERYPQNKVPYIDAVKMVAIPDVATTLAAVRTGKVDMVVDPRNGFTLQDMASLAKTDPEVQQAMLPSTGYSLDMRVDNKPFNDIRVRQALNMAIDRATIAKTYYMGLVDGKPAGLIFPTYKGWAYTYDQWPDDLKAVYSYNPTQAKKLLADAGYPDGFQTNVVASSGDAIDLLEIIKSEFMDIGVDMTIKPMDMMTFVQYTAAGKEDQMSYSRTTGMTFNPTTDVLRRTSNQDIQNLTNNNDANYDALIKQLQSASTMDEAMKLCVQADKYSLEKAWSVNFCTAITPIIWQPYVKGYEGEINPGAYYTARLWLSK